jgi:quercetin dioxygenase-like cupin family protein
MSELVIEGAPSMEKILALQSAMIKMPQAQGLVTSHFFANGMYARELHRPAGTVIVGKIHKHEHFFIVTKGEIIAWTEQGMKRMPAPYVHVSLPGTKRVTYAVVDSTAMTVHRTDSRDLDFIEAEIIEAEEGALFDARNALKEIASEVKEN